MLDLIKKHLADLSASKWTDYKASLASDAVYEEAATRQRMKGADDYVKAIQRWKKAFPDLTATMLHGFVASDTVVVEVEWEGTHDGPFEGSFGSIAPTHKRGTVKAAIIFKLKNQKIIECRHYFDLLTVLAQLGVAPALGAPAQPKQAPMPAPRH